MTDKLKKKVLNLKTNSVNADFESLAMEVFEFQKNSCMVYQQYLSYIGSGVSNIKQCSDIPFLPLDFFKKFYISSIDKDYSTFFESSSTSGKGSSKHYVFDPKFYHKNSSACFEFFFGKASEYCHLALLPSYLERKNSSLVHMVSSFINHSKYKQSAFFLHDYQKLYDVIIQNEKKGIPTLLWGVTFALLDFGKTNPVKLHHTSIIETGGMKGRKKELTRKELYAKFRRYFGTHCKIHSEYGMTEMFSQAYSLKNGIFKCPPQINITGREINDPLSNLKSGKGLALNVMDLGNIDTCCFLALQDLGNIYKDGSFEVTGRMDFSEERGCSLMFG